MCKSRMGFFWTAHAMLQPPGMPRGKRAGTALGNPPQNKGLVPGSQAGHDLLRQQHFCNREHDCTKAPGRQTRIAANHRHAGDPGEVTPRAESGGMLVVPGAGFPPVSPLRHTDTKQKPAETQQGCYTPREGAKGNRFWTGSTGHCSHAGGNGVRFPP